LLPDAVFLNTKQTIASGNDLTYYENTELVSQTPLRNYAVSMWIFINQQTHQFEKGTYKNIFNYTDNGYTESKPQIIYYNDMDPQKRSKNVYNIIFEGSPNSENTSYQIDLPGQKWNHLLFNYKDSGVDFYVNGILERNFIMKHVPSYSLGDIFVIGDDNGLDGSICNISYYNSPLSEFQIANIYNLLMARNPPI